MKIKKGLAVIVIVNMMFVTTNSAFGAPVATAEVTIDWSSFMVTAVPSGLNPAPVLTWSNQTSTVNGYVPEAVSVGDWTSSLAMHVGNSASFSNSDLSALTLHSYSEDNDLQGNSSGSIWTLREGEFSAAGSGSVLFSVNYTWKATLLPAELSPFTNFAYAFATLEASTRCVDPRICQARGGSDELNVQLAGSFPSDIGSFQGYGTLNIDVPVVNGDYFYFRVTNGTTANVSTSVSEVPLPPSAWLLASGLVGLLGLSRHRTKQ